jgi:hypothetical protein
MDALRIGAAALAVGARRQPVYQILPTELPERPTGKRAGNPTFMLPMIAILLISAGLAIGSLVAIVSFVESLLK